MPTIRFRSLTEAELPEAVDLFITSVTDLAARRGLPPPPFSRASVEPVYRHIFHTGIFDAAEVDGEIAAICHATVRERLWFLSGFWARPGMQGRGAFGKLLRRVWDEGRERGAEVGFTWASIDITATAAYLKMGMLPGYPILQFVGNVSNPLEPGPGCEVGPLDAAFAASLDVSVRGAQRAVDLAFWAEGSGALRTVRRGGEPVGYYHASRGVVGPAAWSADEHGEAVLALALREAAGQASEVRIALPGINHTAIRLTLQAGLKLGAFSNLLATETFGRLDRYVPSGPSLF